MGIIESHITDTSAVCSTTYSGKHTREYQRSALLPPSGLNATVNRYPLENTSRRKRFPNHDVTMNHGTLCDGLMITYSSSVILK